MALLYQSELARQHSLRPLRAWGNELHYNRGVAKVIFHADLDAFYASVEQLDQPELRGRPVVVGGPPEARGVVAAASYEARRFGVRSAMPMSRALRLCPRAVRVSPRFERYGELSREVMAIFRGITPLVEPLSLDEAFLDVTDVVKDSGAAGALAQYLRTQVKAQTGLTLSVGVGANKTVAKIASDLEKPDGLVVVAPGQEESFLEPLPVRSLWGIGPRTEVLLTSLGIRTVGQLAQADGVRLEKVFGSRASMFQRMARGQDHRPVEPVRERKSIGAETTFVRDLPDGPELRSELEHLAGRVAQRMATRETWAGTITVKLRYADFRTISRQTKTDPTNSAEEITATAVRLLDSVARADDRFRLVGVQCGSLAGQASPRNPQLALWPI